MTSAPTSREARDAAGPPAEGRRADLIIEGAYVVLAGTTAVVDNHYAPTDTATTLAVDGAVESVGLRGAIARGSSAAAWRAATAWESPTSSTPTRPPRSSR